MLKIPTHSIQLLSLNQSSRRQFLRQLSLLPVGLGVGVLPVLSYAADSSVANSVKALTFDVFGTTTLHDALTIDNGTTNSYLYKFIEMYLVLFQ